MARPHARGYWILRLLKTVAIKKLEVGGWGGEGNEVIPRWQWVKKGYHTRRREIRRHCYKTKSAGIGEGGGGGMSRVGAQEGRRVDPMFAERR